MRELVGGRAVHRISDSGSHQSSFFAEGDHQGRFALKKLGSQRVAARGHDLFDELRD